MTRPVPADETPEQRHEREVRRDLKKVKGIAKMLLGQKVVDEETGAVEPDTHAIGKAGDLILAVAKTKMTLHGLDKRHAQKVEAHVSGPNTTDAWLAKKAAEDNDDG